MRLTNAEMRKGVNLRSDQDTVNAALIRNNATSSSGSKTIEDGASQHTVMQQQLLAP